MRVTEIESMGIKGFLDRDEGLRLYELAHEAGQYGACLEIGGYCGKSTLYLGLGCKQAGSILFSIDHHRGSEEQQPGEEYFDPDLFDETDGKVDTFRLFRRAIEQASLDNVVVPIVSTSEIVARFWKIPLQMVFIDGGHSYASAFTDYACWVSHIQPGGYLVIHDIFTDPSQGGQAPYYIYKRALASELFIALPMVKTLGILKRLEKGEVPEHVLQIRDW